MINNKKNNKNVEIKNSINSTKINNPIKSSNIKNSINSTKINNSIKSSNINILNQISNPKNNIPQNINKLLRIKQVVHKYYDVLYEELFKDFFKINIKNKLLTQPIIERKLTIKDKKTKNIKEYTLIPEIYYKEINGNLKIDDNTEIFEGSYGTVYKSISSTTNNISLTKLSSTILKIIEEKNSNNQEFKSLIFNICLLSYLHSKNKDGIKYFCDLYEFGKIKDSNNKFYAIMEDCGYDLFSYFNKINNINFSNSSYNHKLYVTLYIIRECAKALKVLHDINIAHNDVKPDNFLIKKDNGNYYIKIIDFGFAKKFGSIIDFSKGNVNFSTQGFIPFNFYYNRHFKKHYIVDKKCDIYALGISFLELLCNISGCDDSIIDLKKSFIIKSRINEKIETIIDDIILYLKRKIKINTKTNKTKEIKNFISMLETTLKSITYLSGPYKDLSEFIRDIDISIGFLIII